MHLISVVAQHPLTSGARTLEDPLACLPIQLLHLLLLPPALVAELLCPCAVTSLVCDVSIVKRARHRVAGAVRARAEVGIVRVCLVGAFEVLCNTEDAYSVKWRERLKTYENVPRNARSCAWAGLMVCPRSGAR
jgi:hypothetical protein